MAKLTKGGILVIDGLDVSKPAEYISENNTPNCQNMTVDRSLLRKRNGLTAVGATQSETLLGGREFWRSGVNYIVRVGLDEIHRLTVATSTWTNATGTDLTGTVNDPFSFAVPLLSGAEILCFTNYVDAIRKMTDSGNSAALGGSPPKAKFLLEYESYLLLAFINTGTVYGKRVQWCDTGNPEAWSGGNAGAKDLLTDQHGDITGLAHFSNYAAVHKEGCIYLGYLVSSSSVFQFDRQTTGRGTVCNNTIQNLPNGLQAFVARDGIALFNGNTAPLIESSVNEIIRESLSLEYVHKSWSNVIYEKDEYWVAVPLGSQTTPDTVFKYNYKTGACYKDILSGITCSFNYTLATNPTWDDDVGTWDEATDRWDDTTLGSKFNVTAFGDTSGLVYKNDPTNNNDGSTAIDGFWESKDFTADDPSLLVRWGVGNSNQASMSLWAKGNSVTIAYSKDSGVTWTDIETVSLSSDFPSDDSPDELYFDVTSSKIRFRFRNNTASETFYIKQFIVVGTVRERRG